MVRASLTPLQGRGGKHEFMSALRIAASYRLGHELTWAECERWSGTYGLNIEGAMAALQALGLSLNIRVDKRFDPRGTHGFDDVDNAWNEVATFTAKEGPVVVRVDSGDRARNLVVDRLDSDWAVYYDPLCESWQTPITVPRLGEGQTPGPKGRLGRVSTARHLRAVGFASAWDRAVCFAFFVK